MAKLGEVCLINPKSCTLRDDTEVSFIPMTKVGEHGEFDASEIKNYSEVKKTSVYKGYKRDKIEMRDDRAEMSDFPLYLNTVAGGLDCRNQAISGFSFVVKIYALPVVEIIGQFLYLLGRYGFDVQIGYCF